MHRMDRVISGLLVALSLSPLVAVPSAASDGVVTLQVDNDGMVSSDDDHYTSGVEFVWTRAVSERHWTQAIAERLPGGWMQRVDAVAYHASHRIYTPRDVRSRELIEDDRPYAGLVLGGVSLHETQREEGWERVSSLQFDFGMVGPTSGADGLQREVHRVVEARRPRGWRHQLGNEPILNLNYRRQWWSRHELGRLEWQHGPGVVAALGNLLVQAGAGYGIRLGQGIEHSHGMPSRGTAQGGFRQVAGGEGLSWQLFALLEGRFVAHNLLLDGNTLRGSHSVDRREWVGDAMLGLALSWQRWQVSLAHVWRSEEFDEQKGYDEHGALTLSYRL